ncbi:MAG: Ni/Fe-hydrogenase, b-type cytochrome subunit [Anaerolineae bacterium]|nr:Ni/Fe-hydrogenase, b-type cytochrome subunit [Anaerolineae bacterium]
MAAREARLFERAYVWEWPVRFWHWTHLGAMVVLAVTGYYIGNPFIASGADPKAAVVADQALGIMAGARLIHFGAAIALTISILVRLYWFIAGNEYSCWRCWFPFYNREEIRNSLRLMVEQVKFYLFLRWDAPHGVGHNPLAALTYGGMLLLLVIETVTGWALYGLGNRTSIFWTLFGWVFSVASDQLVRLWHHTTLWLLLLFFAVHLYLAVRDDNLGELGTMSSMFDGHKYWPRSHRQH